MMIVYKLTNSAHQTYNCTQWGEGVEHVVAGVGPLCGPGWLHAYEDPRIAILMNPAHGNFKPPVLWEADGDIKIKDGVLKLGCTRLKTIRIIEPPVITNEQKAIFAVACVSQVYIDAEWKEWADKWISGEDRSVEAAIVARQREKDKLVNYPLDASDGAVWAAYLAQLAVTKVNYPLDASDGVVWAAYLAQLAVTKWTSLADLWVACVASWSAGEQRWDEAVGEELPVSFDIYAAMEKAGIHV